MAFQLLAQPLGGKEHLTRTAHHAHSRWELGPIASALASTWTCSNPRAQTRRARSGLRFDLRSPVSSDPSHPH
jgi:hypothetical protein